MNMDPLAKRLQDFKCGLEGRTIFVNEMPAGCNTGLLLISNFYGTPVNQELPDRYETEFRLVARSPEYKAGGALAKKATDALRTQMGYIAETMSVSVCYPETLPRAYRRSVGGYWEFEVDMRIVFTEPGN